jgi:hypothetical protein
MYENGSIRTGRLPSYKPAVDLEGKPYLEKLPHTDTPVGDVIVNAHSHNIYSGTCSNPLTIPSGWFKPGIELKGAPWTVYSRPEVGLDFNKVRCRTCPNCIKSAQYYWYLRAIDEFQASKWSAFGTLTFGEHFFRRKWREENSDDVSSTFIDPPAFDERGRQDELRLLLAEFTLCLKRLRKAGWTLRYMAVTEFGTEGGRPHVHFVVHAPEGSAPYLDFRKALKKNWEHFPGCSCGKNEKGNFVENCRVGWADVRPVRSNHRAAYACKYIGKQLETVSYDGQVLAASQRARLRASIRYGARVMDNLSTTESMKPCFTTHTDDHQEGASCLPSQMATGEARSVRSTCGEAATLATVE